MGYPNSDTSAGAARKNREPIQLGEAIAEAMPELAARIAARRDALANISILIECEDYDRPMATLGDVRAATSHLPDATPISAVMNDQYGYFEGLRIGGAA